MVTEVGTRLLHERCEKPFMFISGDYHCLSTETCNYQLPKISNNLLSLLHLCSDFMYQTDAVAVIDISSYHVISRRGI